MGEWGKRDRTGQEGFGGCCNPTDLYLTSDGTAYTSESGLARIKRHDGESGKFLNVAGNIGKKHVTRAGRAAAGCTSACIAVSPDGSRIYVQDTQNHVIRVLAKKKANK